MIEKENRIKFPKGEQRKFISEVLENLNLASLKGLNDLGLDTSYSSLKNYFNERRLLPRSVYQNLGHIAKISPKKYSFQELNYHWGQAKGGRQSKKRKKKRSN